MHQFIPLVEFAFHTPRGKKTAATMNPGLAYVADTWQVAAEAIIPLNSEGGRTIGVGKLIADEAEKWGKVVRFAGIKPE